MSDYAIPKLTPDDRPWRIDWYGEVDYQPGRHSQPCFRVATSPVLCDPHDENALLAAGATDHKHQRQCWLPIGTLFLIKIGDIWQCGKRVLSPSYQTECFKSLDVNKGTSTFIKAGLAIDDAFLLPLNEHPWHKKQTQSYCASVTLSDERRIIIPCLELIRFYFGSSSAFLHILFTKQISADLFWKNKHYDDWSKRLHLKLADGLSGMSAADIGRIALDSAAWNAARLIFHSGLAASVQRETIYPYTGFPFIGETDLTVSGKWVSYGSKPNATFVAYAIKSCSHPFPFSSLSYEVSDNKKVSVKQQPTTQPVDTDSQPKSYKAGSTAKTQILADSDPGKSLAAKEALVDGSPRFPDLVKKRVWRERYDTSDPPATIHVNSKHADQSVSVGHGESRNDKARPVDIGQGLGRMQLSELDPRQYNFLFEGIDLVAAQAEGKTVTTELIVLSGYTHPVFSLPHLIDEDGEINPVSFWVLTS